MRAATEQPHSKEKPELSSWPTWPARRAARRVRWSTTSTPVATGIPATFTFGLFAISLVSLLVQGKLTFQPTMVTPLVVGGLSGVALALLKSRPAKDWFAGNRH